MKQNLLAWGMIALLMTNFTACEIPTKRLSLSMVRYWLYLAVAYIA